MIAPGYGGVQEINTFYMFASSFLSNGLLIGVFAYLHSQKDSWLVSSTKELDEIVHRNYNDHVKIASALSKKVLL